MFGLALECQSPVVDISNRDADRIGNQQRDVVGQIRDLKREYKDTVAQQCIESAHPNERPESGQRCRLSRGFHADNQALVAQLV